MTENVPARSGRTPNDAGSKSGAQRSPVKKSTIETSRKNSIAGTTSAMTMPTVVRTETRAQRARTTLTTSSPQRLRVGAQPDRCRLRAYGCALCRHALLAAACGSRGSRGSCCRPGRPERRMKRHVLGDAWIDVVEDSTGRSRNDLRLRERLVLHVDEERRARAACTCRPGRLDARRDAALAAVDLERP